MIESLLIEVYQKKLNAEIAELSSVVAEGKCSSIEEYRRKTGNIAGLNQAKQILRDVIKEYNDDDFGD